MRNNWRVDYTAVATTFCILKTFSRNDFLSIKKKHPDMEIRLQKGLDFYKKEDADKYCIMMKE